MGGAEAFSAFGILNEKEIRPVASDGGRDGQPSGSCVLYFTVTESKEVDRLDAQDPRRLSLLLLADGRQSFGRHGPVP
jgi:hypothetical protein